MIIGHMSRNKENIVIGVMSHQHLMIDFTFIYTGLVGDRDTQQKT